MWVIYTAAILTVNLAYLPVTMMDQPLVPMFRGVLCINDCMICGFLFIRSIHLCSQISSVL